MQQSEFLSICEIGNITLVGSFIRGSNYSFLVEVSSNSGQKSLKAVYKPLAGEYPLWDFAPETLAHREMAAYLVSEALGWGFVPPTIYREDAPYGAGSLQLFIEHDALRHYFNLNEEIKLALPRVVLFDILINNADRKGGHFLWGKDGRLWLIDHGICFHTEWKLRTVAWELAGLPLPQPLRKEMKDFIAKLNGELAEEIRLHLSTEEILALKARTQWLSRIQRFPYPPKQGIPYPFPII